MRPAFVAALMMLPMVVYGKLSMGGCVWEVGGRCCLSWAVCRCAVIFVCMHVVCGDVCGGGRLVVTERTTGAVGVSHLCKTSQLQMLVCGCEWE